MKQFAAAIGTVLALIAGPALAEPTEVTVRVLSKDAKFIGSSMGGVKIQLIDVNSEKVLAEGATAGGTGDTEKLVVQPKARNVPLAGPDDAAFRATLEVDRPTLVRIVAIGPAKRGDGMPATVTVTRWLLPGQKPVGDGWVVEMPGLAIDVALAPDKGSLSITAKVTLMCGCPVTPGGLWNADHYTVTAWVSVADQKPVAVPMTYAGEPSTFRAQAAEPPGPYVVVVTATESDAGNTGVAVETMLLDR